MAAGGKAAHGDLVRVDPVLLGLFPEDPHGFGKFHQRAEALGLFPHGVVEDEHLVAPGQKGHGHRVALPLGAQKVGPRRGR